MRGEIKKKQTKKQTKKPLASVLLNIQAWLTLTAFVQTALERPKLFVQQSNDYAHWKDIGLLGAWDKLSFKILTCVHHRDRILTRRGIVAKRRPIDGNKLEARKPCIMDKLGDKPNKSLMKSFTGYGQRVLYFSLLFLSFF